MQEYTKIFRTQSDFFLRLKNLPFQADLISKTFIHMYYYHVYYIV